jgi:predicted small metal-binding protein
VAVVPNPGDNTTVIQTGGYAMKSFSCGDVVPGCDGHWERDTEEGILAAVAGHAAEVHGIHAVPAELVDAVRANITTV